MTNTNALLDRARDLCTPATDYRLAKILGISDTTISRCRRHDATLDNKAVHALASFLQQDFESVLALVEIDRAKTDEAKAFWEKIAPRLVSSLVIGVLATTTAGVSGTSHSAPFAHDPSVDRAIHYAKYAWGIGAAWLRSVRRYFLARDSRQLTTLALPAHG